VLRSLQSRVFFGLRRARWSRCDAGLSWLRPCCERKRSHIFNTRNAARVFTEVNRINGGSDTVAPKALYNARRPSVWIQFPVTRSSRRTLLCSNALWYQQQTQVTTILCQPQAMVSRCTYRQAEGTLRNQAHGTR
jgi:hypothetical protein